MRSGRPQAWMSVLLLRALIIAGCSSSDSFDPLFRDGEGPAALEWGMQATVATGHMAELEGLERLGDTVIVLTEEPLYVTPDTVIPPRLGDLRYDVARYAGGSFLGYTVEGWELWFSEDGALRNVDIRFAPEFAVDELFQNLAGRLLTLYGIPEEGGVAWKRYRFRSWTERHAAGEQPGSGALLTWVRVPGRVTLGYHDAAYADSLESIEYREPMPLAAWKAEMARRSQRKGMRIR